MRFFRAHGLGNDYLLLETGEPLSPPLIRAICDRHVGVGSDGILEPIPGRDGAPRGVRIHNPDGSEAEKSGNGLRIFALWAARDPHLGHTFAVWTKGGLVRCHVQDDHVRVDMGAAAVGEAKVVGGLTYHPVDIGNPHHVAFSVPEDWRARGAAMETSVPGRTNVQYAEVLAPHRVRIHIWERGAGETRSSGSSSCAVAAAGVATGRLRSPVTVEMDGGTLLIEVDERGSVSMEGPVEAVGTIQVDPAWLRRRGG